MKRILLACLLLPVTLFAYTSPGKPTGYVNDFAGILKPETITTLDQSLTDFAAQTGNEITVVTIPSLGDETIETYAVKLFQEWGIGQAKQDNGVLLLVSRDDRAMRIEVGYGLEPVITDLESSHIIRDVLTPAFQSDNYDAGITAAVARLMNDTKGEVSPLAPPSKSIPWSGQLLYLLLFALMFLGSILRRSKSWWAGGIIGGLAGWIFFSGIPIIVGLAIVGLVFDYVVSKNYQKSVKNGIVPPWWIGGGGKGGGGGFGGFGGGMSGGGGASGKW